MSRYYTRPQAKRALWVSDTFDEDTRPQDIRVEVPDHEARFTGLLDANGDEIWQAPRGIGFLAEMD